MRKNPDKRPLPFGWAEHFDSQRKLWYYIDLYTANPCVTFVHPGDGAPNGAQQTTPLPMAKSMSSSSSQTSLRRAQTRLGVRPAGSRDPIGSSRGQRPTDAQQLYSSSVKQEPKVAVSPTLSRRPSLSSIYTGSASSVSEEAIAADRPSILPAVHPNSSAQNSQSYTQLKQVTINATTTSSPSLSPIQSRASHDHLRKVFDYTRLSCEARNVTSNAPYPGPGQSQSFASLPPASPPSGHILPLNIVRRSTTHKYNFSADSIGRWGGSDQISSDVHALYPSQALFPSISLRPSQPPLNASRQPSVRHSNNNVTTAAPGKQDRRTSNKLPSNNQYFPDILSPPTEDEDPSPTSMIGAPKGRSLASASSATEGTLFGIPAPSQAVSATQTIVPEIQSTSDFNSQYQDSSGVFQTQANLTRRQTVASYPIAEQQQRQGQSSSTQMEDWMLQQPQPLRPLRAVPANMNVQVQARRNAESDEGSEKGRSRHRKSLARRLSLFGRRMKEVS